MNSKQKHEESQEELKSNIPLCDMETNSITTTMGEDAKMAFAFRESLERTSYFDNRGILGGYDKNSKPAHYNNENGSIYKFCNDQELNPWEFDIIKRIVRCRKKGQFKEDLEKTKIAIDLYLKEYNDK